MDRPVFQADRETLAIRRLTHDERRIWGMDWLPDSSGLVFSSNRSGLFQLWSLFATKEEREQMFARAEAGGMGYGDVKKDLLARVNEVFDPGGSRVA